MQSTPLYGIKALAEVYNLCWQYEVCVFREVHLFKKLMIGDGMKLVGVSDVSSVALVPMLLCVLRQLLRRCRLTAFKHPMGFGTPFISK